MHFNGNLFITSDSLAYAKNVTSVGGNLRIEAECSLPALQAVGGCLWIFKKCALQALQTVGGNVVTYSNCNLPALRSVGGNPWSWTYRDMPALQSAYGVPGRLIAISTYGLWLGDNGLYYAGCRRGLTKDQAIDHWIDREDERALKFIGAILAN